MDAELGQPGSTGVGLADHRLHDCRGLAKSGSREPYDDDDRR
jgi:hypothetical protein